MTKNLDLGFISPEKTEIYPYRTAFRCDDTTMKQLLDIKDYCQRYLSMNMNSASELIRQSIKFGHVFCLERIAEIKQKKQEKEKKGQ